MVNKVTELYDPHICHEKIQSHIDSQNEDGWRLIAVVVVNGKYKFFWEKELN